jgi:hypothetical protein
MSSSRYILRQINLINLVLSVVLLVFIYLFSSLINAALEFKLPAPKEPSAVSAKDEAKSTESALPPPEDYAIITEQNLFHPDRKVVASAKEDTPLVRPDFVLYGTMVTDEAAIAFLDDLKSPRSSPGRGKRQWVLSIGDKLSGYTLSEVYTDGAVMISGEDRIELAVIDQTKEKVRGNAQTALKNPEEPASNEAEQGTARNRSKRPSTRKATQKP